MVGRACPPISIRHRTLRSCAASRSHIRSTLACCSPRPLLTGWRNLELAECWMKQSSTGPCPPFRPNVAVNGPSSPLAGWRTSYLERVRYRDSGSPCCSTCALELSSASWFSASQLSWRRLLMLSTSACAYSEGTTKCNQPQRWHLTYTVSTFNAQLLSFELRRMPLGRKPAGEVLQLLDWRLSVAERIKSCPRVRLPCLSLRL